MISLKIELLALRFFKYLVLHIPRRHILSDVTFPRMIVIYKGCKYIAENNFFKLEKLFTIRQKHIIKKFWFYNSKIHSIMDDVPL
jgi:hypothetical protein